MNKEYITQLIYFCLAILYVVTAVAVSNYINSGCVPKPLSALETQIK